MLDIIKSVGNGRVYQVNERKFLLYTGNRTVDMNLIRDKLRRAKKKSSIQDNYTYNFSGTQIKVSKIVADEISLYLMDDVFDIQFSGMNDIINTLKQYGTSSIAIENNGIKIYPRLSIVDKYNFHTTDNEKVSVGNFMVHFGDYMKEHDIEPFFRYLYSKENKLITGLMQKYAPIIKKTNFENILGYAEVKKFYDKVNGDGVINNYSPLSDAKYCILVNDSPMKFSFSRIENNVVIVSADVKGEFRHRSELPHFNPYILFTSRKMPSLPSVTRNIKIPNGNKQMTITVYISILKFTKTDMFKDAKLSVDLLSSGN